MGRRQTRVRIKLTGAPDGQIFSFVIAANYRYALLEGLDTTDATLRFETDINEFESRDRKRRPWIYA